MRLNSRWSMLSMIHIAIANYLISKGNIPLFHGCYMYHLIRGNLDASIKLYEDRI